MRVNNQGGNKTNHKPTDKPKSAEKNRQQLGFDSKSQEYLSRPLLRREA